MKSTILAAVLAMTASAAYAEPETYTLDPSHSQVVFSYNHLGFSTTYGMFSGFGGEIAFDADDPANSSVSVSMPVKSMLTGWDARFDHFMGPDFFGAGDADVVTFVSTGIEVTGDKTANITGDLTMNGVTKPVVLETEMTQAALHPMNGKAAIGFDATATVLRTDFNLGKFAPNVSDEVEVMISLEAAKAE